jgi:hypothetical protein
MPIGYDAASQSACAVSPVRVVVEPMRLTTVAQVSSGRPRQF